MNKTKDPTQPGGPLSNEYLFKELSDTKNACISGLNNVSKPVQAKVENFINFIDGGLEYLIDNQTLINRRFTTEMEKWEPYERKTDIDKEHYQSMETKFQPKDPLGEIDFNSDSADRVLKEIELFLNPPKPEKLTYKKAEPLLTRLLDDEYSKTEEDNIIIRHGSFKSQRTKFMDKMRMNENFKQTFDEFRDNEYISIERFNLIINPLSQYYADILLTSFIMKCNRKYTNFNNQLRGQKVQIVERRQSENEPKKTKILVFVKK